MVNRLNAAKVALLIGLGAALNPGLATAADTVTGEAAAGGAAKELRVIPLRSVDNQGGQLELRGQAGQLQFRVPVEAGAKVRDARLRLVYQTTDAVVAERSKMWVYLNQQGIAQLPLTGGDDALRADIVLPPELLTTGQNTLSLWAQQENSRGCDAGSSAALWTRLDPANSYIALETTGPDRDRNLADLSDAASFLGAGADRIELLTPAKRSDATLKAGALVAQGFSLRLPESGLAVRHRTATAGSLNGRDGKVLVGAAGDIADLVADLGDIRGPYIGLRAAVNPGDGQLLVISGRDDAEVMKAAAAFSDPSVTLPATADWTIDQVKRAALRVQSMQEPGHSYRFKELRATTGGISNGTEARTGLELNLPADSLPAGGRKVVMELDYTYAANLAPNSVVNVLVNGRYASMIALNDPRGAKVVNQRVLLPIDQLRPGTNTIAFEPMIGSDGSSGCVVRPGSGKSVAISGDSLITIPDMARVASLPDLQLFASGGFPYVGTSDPRVGSRRDFEVVLTSGDDATIGGALTLLSKLAQTAGHPIDNFAIGAKARYQGDVLMIGPADTLDGKIAADLPAAARGVRDALRPAGTLFDQSPLFQSSLDPATGPATRPGVATNTVRAPNAATGTGVITASMADLAMLERAVAWTSELSRDFREAVWPSRYGRVAGSLSSVDEGSAMMAAFENPVKAQSTVTLITGATSETVESSVAALVKPALWDRLSGGTVAWNAGSMAMQSWAPEDNYRLGDIPDDWHQRMLFVNALFARNPVAWAFLALVGLLVLTGLTQLALNKRQGS
ncbi:cellulose biosynthesis cyclic di-GMP-binding regulatory protein BcsB [Skermanella stibiiresistens]|nr:cellulose biosynthesis cyclic di-GMP-binding regulatory protein BcsB [Skermanella stibiiresistens]